MADISNVPGLLIRTGSPIGHVTVVGPVARLELNDGQTIEFRRENIGGIDWFVIEVNGERVHSG